jgi:TadE-like protein
MLLRTQVSPVKTPGARRATTLVEFAVVSVIFMMIMFGIMEYCLMIYAINITENAAREGARYAIVNSSDTTLVADTQAYVKSMMMNLDNSMANYNCDVYLADATGAKIGSPVGGKFGDYICVDVSVDYVPITPGLILLKKFTIRSKCNMMNEAN